MSYSFQTGLDTINMCDIINVSKSENNEVLSNTKPLIKGEDKTSAKECHSLPIFNRKAKTGQHHNILDHFLRFLTKINCTQLK